MSLSGYVPHVPLNVAREDLRRSFAAGRSFTYAEKIKLMNKLNDEDALITQEHVKGAGRRELVSLLPVAHFIRAAEGILLQQIYHPPIALNVAPKIY